MSTKKGLISAYFAAPAAVPSGPSAPRTLPSAALKRFSDRHDSTVETVQRGPHGDAGSSTPKSEAFEVSLVSAGKLTASPDGTAAQSSPTRSPVTRSWTNFIKTFSNFVASSANNLPGPHETLISPVISNSRDASSALPSPTAAASPTGSTPLPMEGLFSPPAVRTAEISDHCAESSHAAEIKEQKDAGSSDAPLVEKAEMQEIIAHKRRLALARLEESTKRRQVGSGPSNYEFTTSKSTVVTTLSASFSVSVAAEMTIPSRESEKKADVAGYDQLETLLHPSWYKVLENEFKKNYWKQLKQFLATEAKAGKAIYPPLPKIFNAFNETPFDQVRVVILGQDPYHGPGQAEGLAFSVPKGIAIPSSLKNMQKEIISDLLVNGGAPKNLRFTHGHLAKWCRQGVLLMNTSLTVRAADPLSHSGKGWTPFTDRVIEVLNAQKSGLVFLLWGAHAQKAARLIDSKKHHILMAAHPSGLSASRGFFGCQHFSKTNALLQRSDSPPIDWSLD